MYIFVEIIRLACLTAQESEESQGDEFFTIKVCYIMIEILNFEVFMEFLQYFKGFREDKLPLFLANLKQRRGRIMGTNRRAYEILYEAEHSLKFLVHDFKVSFKH